MEYRDGGCSADISIGYDPDGKKIYVYARDLTHWVSTDLRSVISEAKRQEICNNLIEDSDF